MSIYYSYKEVAYLLGCYIAVADKELNEFEVNILDEYLPIDFESPIYKHRQKIFSDDPDRIKPEFLLQYLQNHNYTTEQKIEMLTFLAQTAFGDDYVSPAEKDLIDKIQSALNYCSCEYYEIAANESCARLQKSRLNTIQKVAGKFENLIYDKFADKDKTKTADWLFGSLGYSATLEQITNTAAQDLERIIKMVNSINSNIRNTQKKLSSLVKIMNGASKDVREIARIVESTAEDFYNIINVSLEENNAVLEKKKRNIQYFTIAFMGRTKTGKSTLHKVITQQESDDIGVGRLRTTRYNRSWYWDRLRVIDTPGIGAPNGKTDTEIAKSIIDEADIICYVVTNDSIQETEFDFFDTIKERNKPLYIILNYKSNLSQEIRLQRFIQDPEQWYMANGPQSIRGHINRIHDKLDGKYNMNNVEIIPIHLLAAQLGLFGKYDKETSQRLIEGSHLMNFIRSIKKEIYNSGSLKKSLSVIDGTAYQIDSMCKSIGADNTSLKNGNFILANNRKKLCDFFDLEKNKLLNDIQTHWDIAKRDLCNYAYLFAQNHYDDKKAGKAWESDPTVKSINMELQNNIQHRLQDFNDKAKSEVEEIANDIDVISNLPTIVDDNVTGSKIKNTRLGVGLAGAIITAAAPIVIANIWNPAVWVITLATFGLSIVISIITSLFKSKQDKIREATENLNKQLCDNINSSIENSSSKSISDIISSIEKLKSSVDNVWKTYVENIQILTDDLDELTKNCSSDEDTINSLIGFRILEFANDKVLSEHKIDVKSNAEIRSEFPVKRDWKNQSLTYLYPVKARKKDLKRAEKATQMKLFFKIN